MMKSCWSEVQSHVTLNRVKKFIVNVLSGLVVSIDLESIKML